VTAFSQPSLITCLLPPSCTGITITLLGPTLNILYFNLFCFLLHKFLLAVHWMFKLLSLFEECTLKRWYKIHGMARKTLKLGNCVSDITQILSAVFHFPSLWKLPHFISMTSLWSICGFHKNLILGILLVWHLRWSTSPCLRSLPWKHCVK
jgi:hypothetical protein